MSSQLIFVLFLEALGVVLALIAIWSLAWNRKNSHPKKIEAALESHLHGVLTAELDVVEKELKKSASAAGKDAMGVLHKNHEQLTKTSQELLGEFSQSVTTELTTLLKQQNDHISELFTQKTASLVQELDAYKQQKITELDASSQKVLTKLIQRKVWHSLQAVDQHAVAKQAVQEIIASGELSA